jgi:hypothetical protein
VKPFLTHLESVKEEAHRIGGHALLRSLPGCKKQGAHMDYFTMKSHGPVSSDTQPYSCVLALETGSSIYVGDKKIELPIGSAIIFRGDVTHSGSEYKYDNIRYHLYIDVINKHEASKGTLIRWKK